MDNSIVRDGVGMSLRQERNARARLFSLDEHASSPFPFLSLFLLNRPRERGDNARLGHDWTELSEPPAPGAWQPVTVFFLTSKNRLITRLPRERGGELINSRGKRAFFLRSGNLDEPVNFRRDAFLPAN